MQKSEYSVSNLEIFAGYCRIFNFPNPVLIKECRDASKVIFEIYPDLISKPRWRAMIIAYRESKNSREPELSYWERKYLFALEKPLNEYSLEDLEEWQKAAKALYLGVQKTLESASKNGRILKTPFL